MYSAPGYAFLTSSSPPTLQIAVPSIATAPFLISGHASSLVITLPLPKISMFHSPFYLFLHTIFSTLGQISVQFAHQSWSLSIE